MKVLKFLLKVNNNLMKPELLFTFIILCSAITTTLSQHQNDSHSTFKSSRLLSQKIIDQETKKVQKFIKQKNSFQTYHFSLSPQEKQTQFFIDSMAEQQIQGHISIMWRHKNAFLLPNILASERLKLQILEDNYKIFQKSFYTKIAFGFYADKDKVYSIRITHKNNEPIVPKLITLHIQNFFESYEEGDYKHRKEMKKKEFQIRYKNKRKKSYEDKQRTEKNGNQKYANKQSQEKRQKFQLWMVSERLKQYLMEMKLLINEVEKKHLFSYTVEKQIFDSFQIYWQYQFFESILVVVSTLVQMALVHKLFNPHKILI